MWPRRKEEWKGGKFAWGGGKATATDLENYMRAITISPSQLAIRNKIVFLCIVGGERIGERKEVGSHARASSSTCS
jgi:hypothetical protein